MTKALISSEPPSGRIVRMSWVLSARSKQQRLSSEGLLLCPELWYSSINTKNYRRRHSITTLTVYRGLQGSGKSTTARMHQENLLLDEGKQTFIVERDEIRMELLGSYWTGIWEDEKRVTERQHELIGTLLKLGIDVTSSDTNLRDKDVQSMMELAHKAGAEVKFMDFRDVDLETCIKRDAARDRTVGEDVIRDKHTRFIKGRKLEDVVYKPRASKSVGDFNFDSVEPYVPGVGVPTVLVDLDNTLADNVTRSPYDTSKYLEDALIEHTYRTVKALHEAGYQIDIMTGRHEDFRKDCESWLSKHDVPYVNLHMRQRPEIRDDVEKISMFEANYRGNDEQSVKFCIDDRDRVVSAYRNFLKIPVLQANYGDF